MSDPDAENLHHADFAAWTWDMVEELTAKKGEGTVLPALISTLRLRGVEKTSLRAAAGMDGLFFAVGRTPRWSEQSLRLRPVGEGKIEFAYLNCKPLGGSEPDWTHIYPESEVENAFDRFLLRAGWFAKGHPFIEGRV